ncbi:MAG: amidohydrolase family protein, partial [Oscillospiraceae bacterium]|nr:amidohydrolase family protein [Oscillospiraceae bacterium]
MGTDNTFYSYAFLRVKDHDRKSSKRNEGGASNMIDLLIKNAKIADGSGAPVYEADVAIKDGKIVSIGNINKPAEETIDADGLIVAPGFIDVHGHSDMLAILDPGRASKLRQGITTEICGQCGLGPAPVSEEFYPQYVGLSNTLGAPIYPDSKSFTSFGAYLKFMENMPLGINTAYFIPHGTLRLAVMGLSPEKPTADQLEQMKKILREGMESGALGLSSGLMYAPGIFASEEE